MRLILVFPGVIVVFVSAVSFACDSWLPADVAHNWATNGDVDGGRIGGGSTFGYMWYLEYRDTDRVGRSSLCLLCRGSVTIFQWFVSCPEISFAYATIFFQLSRFFFGGGFPCFYSCFCPCSFFVYIFFQGEWKIAIALFLFSLWAGLGQFEFDLMKLRGRVFLIVISLNSFQRFS